MKITGIEIERFGVWQDLSLTIGEPGISVVYGPNEAGKTTLLRFIRGVLYGFDPFGIGSSAGRLRDLAWEGALRVAYQERPCEIRRVSSRGTRGLVRVTGLDREEPAETLLSEILGGTDERVFQNVLAVGLPEIQELATLHDSEVARHIYGATLGPIGRRLLEISTAHEKESNRLIDDTTNTGELIDSLERDHDLAGALDAHRNLREEHAELSSELNTLSDRIEDLKAERSELEHQLRGHQFLDRVWDPWNQVQEYEAELTKLPEMPGFPADGLERLSALETELDSLLALQNTIVAQADALRTQAEAINLPPLVLKHAATIQSFVDQREWLEESTQKQNHAASQVAEWQQRLDERLTALGPDWSVERLGSVDSSPSAQQRLLKSAVRYRSVLVRRARLKNRLKRLSAANHQKTDELNSQIRELGGLSLDDALAAARRQLAGLEDLGRFRLREHELELRHHDLSEKRRQLEQQPTVPRWFPLFLAALALAGVAVTVLGLHFGLTTNAIGGASFTLLGLTGLGIVWGFRKQFGSEVHDSHDRLQEESHLNEAALLDVRGEIARLMPDVPDSGKLAQADLVRRTVQNLTILERLSESQQTLQTHRRRVSDLRLRFQNAQRDVAAERQGWCELLTRLGLVETVRIDAAFELWQKVLEAELCRREWAAAESDWQNHHRTVEAFCNRMHVLAQRIEQSGNDIGNPLEMLADWENQLTTLARNQAEYRCCHDAEKQQREEAGNYQGRIDALRVERSALLVQGGAANRDEFERRAGIVAQRREIEELLTLSREDLETAAQTEPDLAVVEEDLQDYNAEENTAKIQDLRQELGELELELHSTIENLGRVKQSLEDLEDDVQPSRLRFEKTDAELHLRRAAEEWFALQIAGKVFAEVRTNFERTCQPAVLASASKFLERLTRGRFRNIWTPLDRCELRIDDDHGITFSAEQLSGGTREQLFLAVRLAVIREFTRQGIELPMILDDILVNFDQLRTETAVETLLEFAAEGQQILFFTCHLHLAHLFESRGIEPTWLPGHNPPLEERRAG